MNLHRFLESSETQIAILPASRDKNGAFKNPRKHEMSEIITATDSHLFLWYIVDHIIDYIILDWMINNEIRYGAIWMIFLSVRKKRKSDNTKFPW